MKLLKWKIHKEGARKIYYAEGCIYRHWEIEYKKEYNGFTVKLPEGDANAYGWTWYTFSHLQPAKDACEWWNREILMTMFTKDEVVVINKFFEKMDAIADAHANE